jgi:hypothetical protein
MPASPTPPFQGGDPSRPIDILVGQALDDLDEGRLDATALRVALEIAWWAGYEARSRK